MSRSVVYTLHLRPPFAHARHSAGEQRLPITHWGHRRVTMTPSADAEPGPVNYHPGPDFIPHEPRA